MTRQTVCPGRTVTAAVAGRTFRLRLSLAAWIDICEKFGDAAAVFRALSDSDVRASIHSLAWLLFTLSEQNDEDGFPQDGLNDFLRETAPADLPVLQKAVLEALTRGLRRDVPDRPAGPQKKRPDGRPLKPPSGSSTSPPSP